MNVFPLGEVLFNLAKSSRASFNKDEARRIAANIAKLPELLLEPQDNRSYSRVAFAFPNAGPRPRGDADWAFAATREEENHAENFRCSVACNYHVRWLGRSQGGQGHAETAAAL